MDIDYIISKLALLDKADNGLINGLQLYADGSWHIESEAKACVIASGDNVDSLHKYLSEL